MLPRSIVLLADVLAALEKATRFISGSDLEAYLENDLLQSAVERQFEIVGEALTVLRRLDPETAKRIPNLERAIGFRNILAHDYSSVDQDIVWIVATAYGPDLEIAIEALLAERPRGL